MTMRSAHRIPSPQSPFVVPGVSWSSQGRWPANWVSVDADTSLPFVAAYRLELELVESLSTEVHVSADERYSLFVDGDWVGSGVERCDADHWAFDTYQLSLPPGKHVIVARVCSLGDQAAFAQHSVRHGFFLCPADANFGSLLATGTAQWEAKVLGGWEFKSPQVAWGTGANVRVRGDKFSWGYQAGAGEGWEVAKKGDPGASQGLGSELGATHLLRPSALPPQMAKPWTEAKVRFATDIATDETRDLPIRAADHDSRLASEWAAMLGATGEAIIPAHTKRRILIDLDDYVCAYPRLQTDGGKGSHVRIHWQEGLFEHHKKTDKGNRDEIEGKYFATMWSWEDGVGDSFYPAGGTESYETLWWQCGRYVEVLVETADEPLTLKSLQLIETRYPLESKADFASSDPKLAAITPLAVRVLQMCSHETFMDCPFYEQLQYVGDTRLQALVTCAISPDDRLPRQALRAFDASRQNEGITQSRYPSRVRQIIPPFSLWWVCMIHDFAMWRDDSALIRDLMPGVRAVLDHYRRLINLDGLLEPVPGWNFVDWVPTWRDGQPPTSHTMPTAPTHFQLILALRLAADLESKIGEPELAVRQMRLADRLTAAAGAFWSKERNLYADDLAHEHYSEHSQILAYLGGVSKDKKMLGALFTDGDLARTTIYFRHYLFETLARLGRGGEILDRLDLWHTLVENGLKTTIEMPEPTRSDCHAWGAHPLYHFLASVLGIRPGTFGFRTVRIVPSLGYLTEASGRMVHPAGSIHVRFHRKGTALQAEIVLPDTLTGVLVYGGQEWPLASGSQSLEIRP